MAKAMSASSALFRSRDLFVHDGTKLRRVRLSASLQAAFASILGVLVVFSGYSAYQFAAPQAVVSSPSVVPVEMARLAAATEIRVNQIEQRQMMLAAMLAGKEVDPALLRRMVQPVVGAAGGPLEPVTNGDATFKQLFTSWKKLDNLQAGAIAVPSDKPVQTGAFTSGYGVRSDPFRGGAAMHAGIDLSGPTGTPIHATADGVVSEAGWNSGGYGNLIKLDHGRGIETRYAHLSKLNVRAGQRIKRGDVIGRMGSTGRSTGSHLHYEVRIDGRAVNPIPFMKSTDYLLAMQKNGGGQSMDGAIALGGPKGGAKR